jgi:hypothetical protein
MAKRFTDTSKWKKEFIKGLSAKHKLLWFYILDDCDHAGIWEVDFEVAALRIGEELEYNEAFKALGEQITPIGKNRWWIKDFVLFQYGMLTPKNKMYRPVMDILQRYGLSLEYSYDAPSIPHKSTIDGGKVKDKEKDMVMVKDMDMVEYGKSENYFHGEVPNDLLEYAEQLKPAAMKADDWQKVVQRDIQALGYRVVREVACEYASEDGEAIEGFIDLQADKNGVVIGIELDNRVTTRDSVAKVHRYPAGMVLLRDPKPKSYNVHVKLPSKHLVTSTTFEDAELWTKSVVAGDDEIFNLLLRSRSIQAGEHLKQIAEDHLGLASRYNWVAKWTDQNAFRQSLVKHIQDTLQKDNPKKPTKSKVTFEDLKLDDL